MSIIHEVQKSFDAVTSSVHYIQIISGAICNGMDFVKTKYPQACGDLAVICEEMRKSLDALIYASSIVTHFKFMEGGAQETDAMRFHDHLVKHKQQAGKVEQRIDAIRGHCQVILRYAEKIREKVDPKGTLAMADILGIYSPESAKELAGALEHVYNEQLQYNEGVYSMALAVKGALQAVEDELGPPGIMHPEKVPNAAEILNEYAVVFEGLEARCKTCVEELQASIDLLQ